MSKGIVYIFILLGAFLLLILGIGGYYLYNKQSTTLVEQTPQISNDSQGLPYTNPCETGDQKGCIMLEAYSKLKKSSLVSDYTVLWSEAFDICENYSDDPSILFYVERCKLDVCDNLHLGDGNVKYNYPEAEECRKEAIKNSSCTDGLGNGRETDIDCGGPDCNPCIVDQRCRANSDCVTGSCNLSGTKYRFRCLNICLDGPIKENTPCGCGSERYGLQGREIELVESWEEQYGNGKTLFCCNGITNQLYPNDNCPVQE